jgi:hypothetical protein
LNKKGLRQDGLKPFPWLNKALWCLLDLLFNVNSRCDKPADVESGFNKL